MNYGLRLSSFLRLGQNSLNIYQNDEPVIFNAELQIYEQPDPIETVSYDRSEIIESYMNLEPRFAIAFKLNDHESIKASFNKMSQYLHLLSNTNSPNPLDVWTPSGKYIEPQLLNQYALGFFKTFKDNAYALEIEGF